MPRRIQFTLGIIAGIGVGIGAIVFAVLVMVLGQSQDDLATIAAIGSTVLAASLAALVAHLCGGFRRLEDDER